ncbi:NUDIX hydrolase [uncultured Enterovirga sp.]|uniref:NUDIX hydrolase n=1 Tax=uncultured Enterovirga sp. TaxID=2026352 RepID=UPI0035C96742
MSTFRIQYGALPYTFVEGQAVVLLATSRDTRRWIIPKGWPMKGKSPHQTAAREAFEEAGIKGDIGRIPVGSYEYGKRLRDGAVVLCRVEVFPLRVTEQRRRWPEYHQRETAWFSLEDAASSVQEGDLAALILGFRTTLAEAA